MRRIVLSFALVFFVGGLLQGQETRKIREVTAKRVVIKEYYVLKQNKKVKHGVFKEYFKNTLISEGSYNLGKRDGFWNFMDYGGIVNFNGKYKKGIKDSIWTYYRVDTLQSKLYYSNGQLDSAFSYYPDGRLLYSKIIDEKGVGESFLFYNNGILKEYIPYVNGIKEGLALQGFNNGNLFRTLEYKSGKPYSIRATFNQNGDSIYGGSLKNGEGRFIGYNIELSADSALKPSLMATFENGELNGPYVSYPEGDHNGEIGIFKNSIREGKWITYNTTEIIDSTFYSTIDTAMMEALGSVLIPIIEKKYQVFSLADIKLPLYPEGTNGLKHYVDWNLTYPHFASNNRYQGVAYVAYMVDVDGNITTAEALDISSPPFKEEALRVINSMPRWNPGFENGVPTSNRYLQQIEFVIWSTFRKSN